MTAPVRILVVEDDFVSRSVLARFLAPFGQVDLAEDGQRALEMVRQGLDSAQPYELITLDIMMPGMDGHATLTALRELERERRVGSMGRSRVLMTTALDDVRNISAAFRGMCDDYIVKPIRKPNLYEKIGELGFPLPA